MRRRRLLAMGTAIAGFSGCLQGDVRGARTTSEDRRTPSPPPDSRETTASTSGATTPEDPPAIGSSLHGRPHRLGDSLGLVHESGTPWIHAFLDVRRKYESDTSPRDDPDVAALQRVGRETGARLFVSLQWNFIGIFGEQGRTRMPPHGSDREGALIRYATDLLTAIDEPVDIVGLGNEPLWETLDADFRGRGAPLVPFTHRLKDHVVEHYDVTEPRLLVGALTRLYSEHIRREYRGLYRQLLLMARNDDDVDGVDLHVHYRSLEEAEKMLYVARRAVPDGLLTATEFSPVWRYNQHKDDPLGSFDGGEAFGARFDVPAELTVTEYLEAAKEENRSPREMGAFMAAMPWYNVSFVADMHRLLSKYGVEVGTFGFVVEDDVHAIDWTDGWTPFPINCLFQPALIDGAHGAHPHYLEDFRRLPRARPSAETER